MNDEICPRCGANEQAAHHPLCESRDGTPTDLPAELVREAIVKGGAMPGLEVAANVLPFRRRSGREWSCAKCMRDGSIVNIGRVHWCYCTKCRTRWRFGENLFSSWHHETPEDWDRNARELAQYREVLRG